MSVSKTLLQELQDAGFTPHPDNKGVLVSKKFKDTIVAASPASAREAIKSAQQATPTYPSDHVAGMRVPKGGSSCAKCEYLADNKTDCRNEYFQKWNGSPVIPGKIDEYCSDWFEPKKNLEAATETSQQGDKEGTLWNGIKITGFTGPEEEGLRAMLSRIPPELLSNVSEIASAKELSAKHGRFIPETKVIQFNPTNFSLRQRMGKGQGWLYHAELTVVHEVGHSIYSTLSPEQKIQWHTVCGWKKGWSEGQAPAYVERRPGWEPMTSTWTHKKGLALPRYYSEKTPNECFSDCFAFFLLNKAHQMSPNIKSFMDNLIKERVKKYPQASIQSPIHAGGPGSGRHKEGQTREDLIRSLKEYKQDYKDLPTEFKSTTEKSWQKIKDYLTSQPKGRVNVSESVVQTVPFDKLVSTQDNNSVSRLLSIAKSRSPEDVENESDDNKPIIKQIGDKFYIVDGHHRLEYLHMMGRTKGQVRVLQSTS